MSTGPFSISKDLVRQLDDVALRSLLGKLLEAEAASRGVPMAAIDLGGNQNAPDGGIDAALSWQDGPKPVGWLPRRMTYYQCKAQALPPAAVEAEMRPSGSPRPIFARLAREGGAYVIFSTDDIGTNGIDARLARMRAAIADVGDSDRIHLDFLGADRIARWVNQHLGVAMWLLAAVGRPLGGWRPCGDWSAPGSSAFPYVIDETARAAVGGQEGDVRTAITAIRGALASPGGTVRLVGLSGMGKTRLAEALFDTRVHGGKALAAATSIYGDTGLDLDVGAALVAEQLAMSGIEAVLVADNCSGRTHAQLAEIVRRKGSRTSLITIDYDIGDDQPTDTLVVKLDPNSEGVVLSLIEQRFPKLSESDRLHLARFSGGNARIALKVAERSTDGADLSKLGDAELLDRLFQTGREAADAAVRRVADAAALVYAFQVAPGDRQRTAEHPALARLAGINADTFYRYVGTLLDWGIVQQRGIQRAVMPPPLANRLARPVIRRSDPSALLDAFASHPRLMASFARRLGQLHDEPKAVELARRLMGANGWLGLPAAFDADQQRAFRNLAPAAPEAALAAIERALSDDAKALDHDRSEYADLLAHISYDNALFARAMTAMLPLALAEQTDCRDTQVRCLFLERFWPVLSRTMATGDTRLAFVDRLLDDERESVRALGVEALDHMMDVWHLSSSFMPEFGARARAREWQPRGLDYTVWIEAAFDRIGRIATTDGPNRDRARKSCWNTCARTLKAAMPTACSQQSAKSARMAIGTRAGAPQPTQCTSHATRPVSGAMHWHSSNTTCDPAASKRASRLRFSESLGGTGTQAAARIRPSAKSAPLPRGSDDASPAPASIRHPLSRVLRLLGTSTASEISVSDWRARPAPSTICGTERIRPISPSTPTGVMPGSSSASCRARNPAIDSGPKQS